MEQQDKIQLFEDKRIRTAWDEEKEDWYFSIVDVVGLLTDQPDQRGASNSMGSSADGKSRWNRQALLTN